MSSVERIRKSRDETDASRPRRHWLLRNDIDTEIFKRFVIAYIKKGVLMKEVYSTSLKENQTLLKSNLELNVILETAYQKISQLTTIVSEKDEKIRVLLVGNNKASDEAKKMKSEKENMSKEITELKNEIKRLKNLTWFDKLWGRK